MIHEGKLFKFIAEESRADLASQKQMMDLIEERYNRVLAENSRGKLTPKQLAEMCAVTTWFTAAQAQKFGLVDEVK